MITSNKEARWVRSNYTTPPDNDVPPTREKREQR